MEYLFSILKGFLASSAPGQAFQDWKRYRSIVNHKSRLGTSEAEKYSSYLTVARSRAPVTTTNPVARAEGQSFAELGYSVVYDPANVEVAHGIDTALSAKQAAGESIWDEETGRYTGDVILDFPAIELIFRPGGKLSDTIEAVYGTHFKIFHAVMYRSIRLKETPLGSQLWHADGGPGTCINLMFAITDLTVDNGAMELLPWPQSCAIYRNEQRYFRKYGRKISRDDICEYYRSQIEKSFSGDVKQPVGGAGTVLMFRNNTIHKGGFPPMVGAERRVVVAHLYPSEYPPPFELYRQQGLKKTTGYPIDPAF